MKILLFFYFGAIALFAENWVLVTQTDTSISKLNQKQIRKLYLQEHTFINGIKFRPLNLSAKHQLRKAFEKEILKMSRYNLRRWWTQRHYMGIRPPHVVVSTSSMLSYIQNVKGAIGYLPKKMIKDTNLSILYTSYSKDEL